MQFFYRPLTSWTVGTATPESRRKKGAYQTTLQGSRTILKTEITKLGGTDAYVALGFPPQYFTIDGDLRREITGVRPHYPGVIIAFASKWGMLRFACDRHVSWKSNLHAIALTLRLLQEATVHGAADPARLYLPFKIVAPTSAKPKDHRRSTPPPPPRDEAPHRPSIDWAAIFIANISGFPAADIFMNPLIAKRAHRAAALKLHPDRGGQADQFNTLQEAWAAIQARHGL